MKDCIMQENLELPVNIVDLIRQAVDQNVDAPKRNTYRTRMVNIVRALNAAIALYDKQLDLFKNRKRIKPAPEDAEPNVR
jgi:hypothetical protein